MSNDIRENAIVKEAILLAKGLDGKDKYTVDTTSEISIFKQYLELNKKKMSENDFNEAIKLFDNVQVENTGDKYGLIPVGGTVTMKRNDDGKIETESSINQYGIYLKEETMETTEPVANENPEQVSKYMAKGNKKDYFRVLENEASTMTRAQLQAHMQETYKNIANNENIIKYQQAFNDVLALMPTEYASIEDIKKQHDSIIKKLKEAGKKDDLHKDILEQLEVAAKNEIRSTVAQQVKNDFQQRLQAVAENGDFTQEKTIAAMYEELEQEEKNIKDLDKADRKTAKAQLKEKKAALEQLEKTFVVENAKRYVHEAITSVHYTDKDSEGAIQDVAIAYLKEHKMWDKYTEKLMSRANLFKKDSYGESTIEKQQKVNRVRKNLVQTEKEIKDTLGKNDSELLSSLVRNGLITKTEDGKYDLTVLSAMLGKLVGQDFTLSATSKENKMISEKVRTTGIMAVETGFKDLKSKEAKELLRLCGYDIEGINWAEVAKGTLIGAAFNALAGGVAAATNPKQDVLLIGGEIEQNVTLKLKGDVTLDDIGGLPEDFEFIQNGAEIIIKIHQFVKNPDLLIEISKHITETSLKTALAGALGGALAALDPKGEAWITATQFAETDINKYAKQVEHMNPKYATALTLLAETFVKDGKWDVEAYKQYLNTYAGDGSPLNEKEFYNALQDRLKDLGVPVVPPKQTNDCEDGAETCEASITPEAGVESTEIEDKTYIHPRKAGDTWKGIVEAYYPGLVEKCGGLWGKNGAIKALQRELCTDENGNFDKAKFQKLITATDLPKEMKMPLKVNGIDRQINGVKAGEFTEAKGDEIVKALDKVGRDEKVSVTKVAPGTYVATDNCDSSQKAVGNTKEEALKNLKEKTGKTYTNEAELLKN